MQVEEPLVCCGMVRHHPLRRQPPSIDRRRRGALRSRRSWKSSSEFFYRCLRVYGIGAQLVNHRLEFLQRP